MRLAHSRSIPSPTQVAIFCLFTHTHTHPVPCKIMGKTVALEFLKLGLARRTTKTPTSLPVCPPPQSGVCLHSPDPTPRPGLAWANTVSDELQPQIPGSCSHGLQGFQAGKSVVPGVGVWGWDGVTSSRRTGGIWCGLGEY